MSVQSAAARRYATALVESASQTGPEGLDKVSEELARFSAAVDETFDLRNVLTNPVFTQGERSAVLEKIISSFELSDTVQRFLKVLVQRDRIGDLAAITETFIDIANQRRGKVHADVRSAQALAPEALSQLKSVLERRTGKTIDLDVQVDPDLLGGIYARVGTTVFDGTLRAELNRLRESLIQAE